MEGLPSARGGGGFGIAVAGYPEKHIEAPDPDTDLRYLKEKVDAGADVVITQLFYRNEDYFRFEQRARAVGITVPIVPGILSIQSYQQVMRITSLCGATIPEELEHRLQDAAEDPKRVQAVGVDWAIEQCRDLIDRGVPGIHFYVLNRSKQMERIVGALRQSGHLGS